MDDPQDREAALDAALSRFYRGWLAQEDRRQRTYTWSMYMWTLNGIQLALRNRWQQLLKWLVVLPSETSHLEPTFLGSGKVIM